MNLIKHLLLSTANKQLKEVSVTGVKPIIKQAVDRIRCNIRADPENKAFNVVHMMRSFPLFSLNADDKGSANSSNP